MQTTIPTEKDCLVRAILADPDDDAPRLALADWLDEHGESDRASFIRVQVELARMSWVDDSISLAAGYAAEKHNQKIMAGRERQKYLREREQKLLIANGCEWFKLPGLATYGSFEGWVLKMSSEGGVTIPAVVSRGFVSSISLTTAAFLGDNWPCGKNRTPGVAAAVFRSQPVTAVRLSDREPTQTSEMMGLPGLWAWSRISPSYPRSVPPRPVFQLLQGYRTGLSPFYSGEGWKFYDTADLAHEALSRACVRYGRRAVDPDGRLWPHDPIPPVPARHQEHP